MDHWGDPWADNTDEQQTSTKNTVTSQLPPTNTSAPVLLNGFLDDAGWGNDDDTFGDWATSSADNVASPVAPETRVAESTAVEDHAGAQSFANWESKGTIEDLTVPRVEADNWSTRSQNAPDVDGVPSETSDSSTTIQLDENPVQLTTEVSGQLQPDDDSSARPSTSPSETSHYEVPVESPRTSIEEERGAAKPSMAEHILEDKHGVNEVPTNGDTIPDTGRAEHEQGAFSLETSKLGGSSDQLKTVQDRTNSNREAGEHTAASSTLRQTTPPTVADSGAKVDAFKVNMALLDDLYPASRTAQNLEEAPEDPIYSTAGRKAWYRLTRKQTLREYNGGNGDDNYIRVTWANSHIRSEVNKIVGRWAREDRISGTGPGARASFYWDSPAPIDTKIPGSHSRTKTAISTPRVAAPARQSLPPMSTSTTVAFNWSSTTASVDPWKHDSPALPSMQSPIMSKHNFAGNSLQQEMQPVDVDATSQNVVQETPGQTSTTVPETLVVSDPSEQLSSNAPATSSDPCTGLSSLDTDILAKEDVASAPFDDDDDWGEMVTSPTFAPTTPIEGNTQVAPGDNRVSNPSSPLHSTNPSSNLEETVDSMHASPIVRLRSTISPTSAIFGAKSFVPLGVEQGPIGPGLLKPAKKSVSSTLKQSQGAIPSTSLADIVLPRKALDDVAPQTPPSRHTSVEQSRSGYQVEGTKDDNLSAFAPCTSLSEPARPATPALSSAATNLSSDSWADADFSFFESTIHSSRPPHQRKHDPSDPFSAFESPPRPVSATSSAKTFTRSPPRNVTPPPVQPLSGATNSAQRRKVEEEQIIRNILKSLPDLSYMLR